MEGSDDRLKDNRGLTLIELIVVMAILGVLMGGTTVGYNLLNSSSSKNIAERITALMSYVKVENMSKSNAYSLQITKDSGSGKYLASILSTDSDHITKVIKLETLDLKEGEITFENNLEATQYLISSVPVTGREIADKLMISYRRDTGALQEYSAGLTVTRIGITTSGRTSYIRLVAITGKHYME